MGNGFVGRLVILSGPSCVGKGPLHAALKKFYPDLAERLPKLVLYDSRPPRPGERDGVDYHFRSRSYIEGLRNDARFRVFEVRNDLQALDLDQLEKTLGNSDAFFEGNPFIGSGLLDIAEPRGTERMSVFLSPLDRDEVLALCDSDRSALADVLTDMMRRKLLRRTTRQKGLLSQKDLENIEVRAASAYRELQQAWRFDYVIPNHDGEDSEHWDGFYRPVGDARKALLAFAGLLQGSRPSYVEQWEKDLVP
jgi:guanylate kinase